MEKVKKPFWKKWWFWAIVVIVLIAIAANGGNSSNNTAQPTSTTNETQKQTNSSNNNSTPVAANTDQPKQTTEQEKPNEPENKPTISKAEFEQIKTGMTYEEVVKIIGGEGNLLSETKIGNIHSVMYEWDGEGMIGANANFIFQNGKLQTKSQFGLE